MIQAILLAGGASTRFGSPKLLHLWTDDLTLGQVSAANLLAGVGNVLAVVRAGDAELAASLRDVGCEVLETERATEGMGASLAAGIECTREAAGWVVALADMPHIRRATIAAVADALRAGATIAAPARPGSEHGHPVGFAASLGAELMALTGDRGARAVVERHRDALVIVPTDDPGIAIDIDRPADLGS